MRIKLRDITQAHSIIKDVAKIYTYLVKSKMTQNQMDFKLNTISYTDKFNGLKKYAICN